MHWIGILFLSGLLAEESLVFSSLNPQFESKKLPIPTRKVKVLRKLKDYRSCECGIPNTSNRIVGGYDTGTQQYPWMVMLMYSGRFYCGGSLINSNYVLTAAHCLRGFSSSSISVNILAHMLDLSTPGTFNKKVIQVTTHPLYSPSTFDNDIALLKLESKVQFDDILRPVCLPFSTGSYSGEMGLVTGWGDISENSHTLPTVLREVYVPILSNEQCSSLGLPITKNMMCAGEEGKDSCQGDSGGPLHLQSGSKYQQIGIVSWGFGCARPDKPGVYTRISNYINWIKMNSRDGSYCS